MFRLSSHSLQIELGRHNNTPINDRLCTRCDYNAVDDEEHFLIHCSFLMRKDMFYFTKQIITLKMLTHYHPILNLYFFYIAKNTVLLSFWRNMFAYVLIKQKRDFKYLHIFHLHIIELCLCLPLYLYILLL